MNRISGTKEWAKHSVNFQIGCRNNCRYCYARNRALVWHYCAAKMWTHPRIRKDEVLKNRGLFDGRVMFPTTHDIRPENLSIACTVLDKLLSAGNQVLLVSKPWLECMGAILEVASPYTEQITFRFSITAIRERFREYWEPRASSYRERLECLQYAHREGFSTSVSAEPCLDFSHIHLLLQECLPFVTDTLWIGKLNKPRQRIDLETEQDRVALSWIINQQRDAVIWKAHELYKDNPQIRWKESIKEVVGLPPATEAGQDV